MTSMKCEACDEFIGCDCGPYNSELAKKRLAIAVKALDRIYSNFEDHRDLAREALDEIEACK